MTKYKYINLDYLDSVVAGDEGTRQSLLKMVQTEVSTMVPKMPQIYRSGEWDQLHAIAHQLKSTLAIVGNLELKEANLQILSNLEKGNYEVDYREWLLTMERLSTPVLEELDREIR